MDISYSYKKRKRVNSILLILMGKSASGKSYIAKNLEIKHGFHRIVTTTSRPMRKGETQDIDYHFISKDDFLNKIENDYFVEYQNYETPSGIWYYGTSYESLANIDDEKKYVVILTPNGYKELIQKVNIPHKAIYVYASYSTLMKRLKKRNDKNDFPQRRLERDNEDFKGVEFIVDKLVYNNDGEDIDKVTEKIIKIVEG